MFRLCKLLILSSILWLGNTNMFFAQDLSKLEQGLQDAGMVDIRSLDKDIRIELKYGTTDNFTGVVLYEPLQTAYLHSLAAAKLAKASKILRDSLRCYRLIIYDAARPLSVQRKMYAVVQGTPKAPYVANPTRVGLHNFGMAVDLSICDETGTPLDMGTPFDHLGFEAGINKEEELIQRGILTREQVNNRLLLRKVMVEAGFLTIRGEWWHFNAVSHTIAIRNYKVLQ